MLGSPSILVVEDERSMREFLEILLRRQRYAVTAVNDGAEALAVLEEREFDAVITDLKMPNIGGLDILKHNK